jgi:hypothetical protein
MPTKNRPRKRAEPPGPAGNIGVPRETFAAHVGQSRNQLLVPYQTLVNVPGCKKPQRNPEERTWDQGIVLAEASSVTTFPPMGEARGSDRRPGEGSSESRPVVGVSAKLVVVLSALGHRQVPQGRGVRFDAV